MSRIILPGLHGEEPFLVCRVPDGKGGICGRLFYERERLAWQQHVGRCARSHEAEIRAESLKGRMPVFDPENWDPQYEEHMRKVGERMLREGRLETKPNER